MTSLMERLEALVAAANEPPPKPSPEQDSRAGEAMAGVEDQRRYRAWQDRVLTARAEITELVPEAAALIRRYEDALDLARSTLIMFFKCDPAESHAVLTIDEALRSKASTNG